MKQPRAYLLVQHADLSQCKCHAWHTTRPSVSECKCACIAVVVTYYVNHSIQVLQSFLLEDSGVVIVLKVSVVNGQPYTVQSQRGKELRIVIPKKMLQELRTSNSATIFNTGNGIAFERKAQASPCRRRTHTCLHQEHSSGQL